MKSPQAQTMNGVLASLSSEDFALLAPSLQGVVLPRRKHLESRNKQVEFVYFLESGLASVLATGMMGDATEVGVIGHEGMTGMSVVMADGTSVNEAFMQVEGNGWRLSSEQLRQAMGRSRTLRLAFLAFFHTLVTQMAFTALANARHTADERLARWLLMASDRSVDKKIWLTHEYLALMLGTRRSGVTNALTRLQGRGAIKVARGVIIVNDRVMLLDAANGCYGAPEQELSRLFPHPPPSLFSDTTPPPAIQLEACVEARTVASRTQ
jgi:CRP-like cAMP-binding protein